MVGEGISHRSLCQRIVLEAFEAQDVTQLKVTQGQEVEVVWEQPLIQCGYWAWGSLVYNPSVAGYLPMHNLARPTTHLERLAVVQDFVPARAFDLLEASALHCSYSGVFTKNNELF